MRRNKSFYELVPASSDDPAVTLGTTGGPGDRIDRLTIIPATTSPGAVTLIDGTGEGAVSIPIFAGGDDSLDDVRPFPVELGVVSRLGAWSIETGANVSVLVGGEFTE